MSNISSTWIIIGVLVVLVVWIIMIYNGLVAMRQRVNQSFSDVDVQLKQRHDLIPNLVETVKGYAAHERGTLEAEGSREQGRRELLDAGVVLLHRIVEEAPRGGDLVFEVRQLGLQLLEVLIGLEVGIGLAQCE